MMDVAITQSEELGIIPDDERLGFGKIFTDHMFIMDYSVSKGWHSPRIVPYSEISMYPAAMVLHYGQAIFEGMKAFRTVDNRIVVFRSKDHLNRFNKSAECLCIPPIDVDEVQKALFQLLEIDKRWVPTAPGTALYIRPFAFAVDPYVGLKLSDTYHFAIILSPVGAYYASGFKPVSIKVEDHYVRAVKGGLGEAKTLANYAMSLRAQVQAYKEGFTQVLWLDAVHRRYIEEVGSMNILFKINGEIVTPALNGSILDGITRKSVLEVAKDWGMKVSERQISIDEVFEAHDKGQLDEVFGSGTAAVISPVGKLSWKGREIAINNNETGEFCQKLFNHITGIQYGKLEDKFGWLDTVTKV